MLGSTSSDQAVIPPCKLLSFRKPASWRILKAFALRPPTLQCKTMSSALSSSLSREGNSPSGINFDPGIRLMSYSNGSRTSTSTNFSLRSIFVFNSVTVMVGTSSSLAASASACGMPQNWS